MTELAPEEWLYFARTRLIPGKPLHEAADETIEVSPAIERYFPPAIFLEPHLDNIVAFHPEGIDKDQIFRIRGGKAMQPATLAFKVKNVTLNSPGITSGLWRGRYPSPPVEKKKNQWMGGDTAAISATYFTVKYFGHWMKEECITRPLADEFGEHLSIRTSDWPDKDTFGKVFDQEWSPTDTARLKTAYFFFDDGHTASRVSRTLRLRKKFREKYSGERAARMFYLKRPSGGLNPRKIANEDELIAALEKAGVKIIEQEKLQTEEMLAEIAGSDIMITIEGSQQAIAYYSLSDTPGLVLIMPPNLFNTYSKQQFDVYGCAYGFVVGEARENSFHVDLNDLFTVIEKVEKAVAEREYLKYAFE